VGPRTGLDRCANLGPNGIRSPDRPARSQSLYRLSYPALQGPCTFITTPRLIVFRIKNVSDKSFTENQNTHFQFNNSFSENRAVYEIMWKNLVVKDRSQVAI
jgi:hypothetical protein